MNVIPGIASDHAEFSAIRQDIHAHPETAFEENRTSDIVAAKLQSWGIEVHRGLAKTGVVGTLKAGGGNRAIGLRADMDALDLQELNEFSHKSRHAGKMHGCGHDGHTTMLLYAAKYLSATRRFDGTVHFIFQPAEENVAGGRVMVEEGLFERFPVEAVYGMHNMPGLAVGQIAVRTGPMMASADMFDIRIRGKGGHGAMPHLAIDPVVIGSELVLACQSIVGRNVDPIECGVVSITKFQSGMTSNVIPDEAIMAGTTRAFRPEVQDMIERRLRQLVTNIAAAHDAVGELQYHRRYPALINTAEETDHAARAAAAVVGADNVRRDLPPVMGAEDFAWMLKVRPGSYVWIGNGEGEGSCSVHNPRYDFNDAILPIGASYWATLTEQLLPAS